MRNTRQEPEQQPDAAADSSRDHIAPVPRISVQAFCETEDTAAAIRAASQHRRLAKAHVTVKMGGIATAIDVYQRVPTPNVIILQTDGGPVLRAGRGPDRAHHRGRRRQGRRRRLDHRAQRGLDHRTRSGA